MNFTTNAEGGSKRRGKTVHPRKNSTSKVNSGFAKKKAGGSNYIRKRRHLFPKPPEPTAEVPTKGLKSTTAHYLPRLSPTNQGGADSDQKGKGRWGFKTLKLLRTKIGAWREKEKN